MTAVFASAECEVVLVIGRCKKVPGFVVGKVHRARAPRWGRQDRALSRQTVGLLGRYPPLALSAGQRRSSFCHLVGRVCQSHLILMSLSFAMIYQHLVAKTCYSSRSCHLFFEAGDS